MSNESATTPAPTPAQTLGEFLKHLRTVRRLTLRDVEDASEISNAYLSQLENDKIAKPSPHILHKLAEVYRVAYEALMEKAGYITRVAATSKTTATGRLATFANEKLTAAEEEELLKYLAFLRSQRRGAK